MASEVCLEGQQGGLKGRVLIDNVIDIEGAGLLLTRAALTFPALIMYGFAAAFPSVKWSYRFRALRAMKIHAHVRRAVRAFYADAQHFVRYRGTTYQGLCITMGVKQGCPLSAALFLPQP